MTKKYMRKIAKAIRAGNNLMFVGLTGGGKSDMIRYLSDLSNNSFISLDFDGQSDVSQLIGQFVPVEGESNYKWKDGRLLEAMESGSWILLDEVNLAEAEIIERINSLLDDDGSLSVNEHLGEKWIPADTYDELEAKDYDMLLLRRIHPNFQAFLCHESRALCRKK